MAYQNTDPSIRRVALALTIEVMDAIETMLLAGIHFYVARDRALECRVDGWVSRYGKETADAAARAIYALDEVEMLSKPAKATLAARWKADRLAFLAEHDASRNTWLNRAWIRWFGERLYVLAFAFLALTMAHGGPAAARGGQEIAPRFKALALCGVSKPGPDRDRACAPFNSVERGSYREWDSHGRVAPREWELPRPYEVERY